MLKSKFTKFLFMPKFQIRKEIFQETTEELRIIVDKEKAMEYSLTVAQVFTQIQPKLAEATS
ncbi:MAG: hypothetical protein IIX01_06215, partial [Clostridia bacterium]|nr:hypothetical protein [Clostridia bacterium]